MAYNASSTYKTFLMRSTDGTSYTKVIDIKEFPDLGAEPDTLDTTTMTDAMRTSILGLQDVGNLSFQANYDPDQFQTLQGYVTSDESAPNYYAVYFGGTDVSGSDPTPTGALGMFKFKGRMACWVEGAGVNEVRNIAISIAPATKIEFSI